MYAIKTPWWLKQLYPSLVWNLFAKEKNIYLTFDDGPHPEATPFVLDLLAEYGARATFFCIGKNVVEHSAIFKRIVSEGHAVGNHTNNHLSGWKTSKGKYLENISLAAFQIPSKLFRPPYGQITGSQIRKVRLRYKIIMWDVLSADFDTSITGEACYNNVVKNIEPGSVVVFHDSAKAYDRLVYALPRVLDYLSKQGYFFLPILE